MIIDFERRFLFLKSTKTAGTSIEIILSRYCTKQSIVTPTVDEELRATYNGRPPQNYLPANQSLGLSENLQIFYVPPWGNVAFFNHMSLEEVISQIGVEKFEALFSFSFTRHPVKRALSSYTWIVASNRDAYKNFTISEHRLAFCEMLRSNFESTRKWSYSEKYAKEVTKVYLYEQISMALEDIFTQLKIFGAAQLELPMAKAGFENILGFPREALLDGASIGIIKEKCEWEFTEIYAENVDQSALY